VSVAERLYARVRMALASGVISATDDSGPIHRVQVQIPTTGERIDNVKILEIFGLASHAPPGSDLVVQFLAGDRSNAVATATGNQKLRLRNLKAGEVALYDGHGSVIKLANGGKISVTCTGEVSVTAPKVTINGADKVAITAPEVDITGTLKVTGDVEIIGNLRITGSITGGGIGGTHWDVPS
jgi:phage baseplate assembly protein V